MFNVQTVDHLSNFQVFTEHSAIFQRQDLRILSIKNKQKESDGFDAKFQA